VPQSDDEPGEDDLLLAFSTEPGGKPPESTESLAARVEFLERELHRSTTEIESLRSELATLVGTVDDISKNARRPVTWAPKPVSTARTRFATAAAGIVLGLAVGVLGWMLWSRDSIVTIDTIDTPVAASDTAAAQLPPESAATPQPVAPPAAAPPDPEPAPEPAISRARPVQARVAYVGTLSIDAAPGGEVFIDRKAAGQTPLRIQNLKAGSHLVWIEREGYRRFTRVVQVPANRVSRVWADLEPIPER
jgi:hypothetical protein